VLLLLGKLGQGLCVIQRKLLSSLVSSREVFSFPYYLDYFIIVLLLLIELISLFKEINNWM